MTTKITLTGDLGSGKSVVSKRLCERTGYPYLSTGQIQRGIAAELGVDTLELNRLADTDPSIDQRIDSVFKDLNATPDGYIVDSRMAWFFIPASFKVYLKVDPWIAARRILSDPTRNSEKYTDEDEAVEKILARKKSENDRFWVKYGADCANMNNFDVVIDTTLISPEKVVELIFTALQHREEGVPYPRYL